MSSEKWRPFFPGLGVSINIMWYFGAFDEFPSYLLNRDILKVQQLYR